MEPICTQKEEVPIVHTRVKQPRTEAQKAAFEKMRSNRVANKELKERKEIEKQCMFARELAKALFQELHPQAVPQVVQQVTPEVKTQVATPQVATVTPEVKPQVVTPEVALATPQVVAVTPPQAKKEVQAPPCAPVQRKINIFRY